MSHLRFSPAARRDVNLIVDHIANSNPTAAAQFVERIKKKCRTIARFPEIGRPRDALSLHLRSVAVENYVIFYRKIGNSVEIIRVLHGARDHGRLVE